MGYNISVKDADKASKWTVFLLVDLKIVFIITFVYISVVNLISTTANNEATTDVNSNDTFTVTAEHTNVNVSFIGDAVLWNCRNHSVTKRYYQVLYWMLIISFLAALVAFSLVKMSILINAVHGKTYLWHIAIVQFIQKIGSTDKSKQSINKSEALNKAKYYRKKLEEENERKTFNHYNCCRLSTLCITSCIILPFGLFIAFTAYDLHPLSCILTDIEENIEYTRVADCNTDFEGMVKIKFSDCMTIYQKIALVLLSILGFVYFINILSFYVCNFQIIEMYKDDLKNDDSLHKNDQLTKSDELNINPHDSEDHLNENSGLAIDN